MLNNKGFTLIEMLIVLLIISVLILVTIPNVTKHFATIDEKGCSAYVSMVQGQVEAYKIDTMKYPTVSQLIDEGYISTEEAKCPSGEKILIETDGKVIVEGGTP
ncbi:competence type IV pilus major pilin ComGC [Lysinibacillus sp. KU-BSD001]|uniref:competence type IV pilus major pilin ComGC n=1 Tax=Lysinibacillus sp. KU-BSD001 TaxID=3141328 RepID=UPI0036E691A0